MLTQPPLCEGSSLALVMTDVSIAMNSYYCIRDTGPKL